MGYYSGYKKAVAASVDQIVSAVKDFVKRDGNKRLTYEWARSVSELVGRVDSLLAEDSLDPLTRTQMEVSINTIKSELLQIEVAALAGENR